MRRSGTAALALVLAACGAGPEEGDGVLADAIVVVDPTGERRPISPFVYGWNGRTRAGAPPGATWLRLGGNRWTAYNWASNWSNAGIDWGPWSNDGHMGTPADGPGAAARAALDESRAAGLPVQVTLQLQGWVARDGDGVVDPDGPREARFVPVRPRKGAPFTFSPDPASPEVFADEFAAWCSDRFGPGPGLGFALDNEPELWFTTHREIQREPLGYAALIERSIATASAVKDAAPSAEVFGPESYGWLGFTRLQDAPDAGGRIFLDAYLEAMRAASGARRLLDVLSVHFYSGAEGCGTVVSDARSGARNTPCVVAARVQAPRSLYDPTYVEESWITRWGNGGRPLRILEWLGERVDAGWPGTRLALSEYHHGGGDHVSGAVAQADTLGALGRAGVYAAALWPLGADETWTAAAWRAYGDLGGDGWAFGDLSVAAGSTDLEHVSAWASASSAEEGHVAVVLVHRPGAEAVAGVGVLGMDAVRSRRVRVLVRGGAPPRARAWRLADGPAPEWVEVPVAADAGGVELELPHLSVAALVLRR